jgi:dCMP deaminase
MLPFPFTAMQAAVDIVNASPHPVNKIAATLFGADQSGHAFSISRTNNWAAKIKEKIGTDTMIGSCSGTVHAETACIFAAPYTDGASLCVTDPFCPNCAKNIVEAGIKTVYIDHKGFDKDWMGRREEAFESLSLAICRKAGVAVYELRRKEEKIIAMVESSNAPVSQDSPIEDIVLEEAVSGLSFRKAAAVKTEQHRGRRIAVAVARDGFGREHLLCARACPVNGFSYTNKAELDALVRDGDKYSLIQEPANRILMNAARLGLKLVDGFFYCVQLPTAREQVNLVGAGITRIFVAHPDRARDDSAIAAAKTLQKVGVLDVMTL